MYVMLCRIGLGRAKARPEIWPSRQGFRVAQPDLGQILGLPAPARTKKIALLAEKLVKNGPKLAKIGGPNWPVVKNGMPEPDPDQKRLARTRPGPEKSGPNQP